VVGARRAWSLAVVAVGFGLVLIYPYLGLDSADSRIAVRDDLRYAVLVVHIFPAAKLDYAEAQDDYVALASQGKKYLKQQTISSLEASLDPRNFVRIHRSYLVNLERVTRLEPYGKDSHVAILGDGSRLPVSRAGLTRLKEFLGEKG